MGSGHAYWVGSLVLALLLVLTAGWRGSMTEWASMFPEKGFTCIQTDLTMPESPPADSAALMHHFETRERTS